MLRVALAVAAGFLTMTALLVGTEFALLRFFFHSGLNAGPLPPAYLLAYGAASLFYAVIGGCITAAISQKYEAPTILGALMLGIGIGGVVMNRNTEPLWFAASIPIIGAIVATMAGYRWIGRTPVAETVGRRGSRR